MDKEFSEVFNRFIDSSMSSMPSGAVSVDLVRKYVRMSTAPLFSFLDLSVLFFVFSVLGFFFRVSFLVFSGLVRFSLVLLSFSIC